MRFIIVSLAALCIPTFALAQPKRPEVTKVHVGFQAYTPNVKAEEQTVYKVGLWTPVYVELFGGATGIKRVGDSVPYIDIESVDSEDVGTSIRVPVDVNPNEKETVIGYVKTGHLSRASTEIKVTLHLHGSKLEPVVVDQYSSMDIDAHLYLTLGNKITDLQRAVRTMDRVGQKEEENLLFDPTDYRQVVFENNVKRLPEAWFGYNGVDLVILTTDKEFLKELNNSPKRVNALAQWVRRGGRLVVPISAASQPIVVDLLKSPVWDPAIPVVPPRDGKGIPLRSVNLGDWAVQDHPFQRLDGKAQRIEVAALDPGRVPPGDWTVFSHSGPEAGKKPLIAQVRYGLGQITYMAFSFEDDSFFQWKGKDKFLQTMITKLGPRAAGQERDRERMFNRKDEVADLSTQMLGMLDNFDVKVIPFGYVALFIVLYILVVGPLDFVLLKYVFKRLEWTWITFPAVVLGVSVLAYFAAYALKGRDLKVNKIDIVDFDLRTDAKKPHAYGHSFFTLLSPRIQNYTVGVEPNPEFWGEKADRVRSVDLMSWMGRPSGGPHDMGRASSSGFFRKPYNFREDAAAMEGVPIPVWTTKAFFASWEQALKAPPFDAELVYHANHPQGVLVSGKLENHLAVDLTDVWLLYDDMCMPIAGGLKSIKNEARPAPIALKNGDKISAFAGAKNVRDDAPEPRAWVSDPSTLVKQLLFHERIDTQNQVRNHLLRPLDLGWRTFPVDQERGERRTREAILFGRVRHVSGSAESVTADADRPLPTKLWLGDTPEAGKSRRALIGQLNQDTYIRAILAVNFAD